MTRLSYTLYDPTGNMTVLVTDPVRREDHARTASAVMERVRCEQVGFLSPARKDGALVRLDMMGGEFCGNAAMCAAAHCMERGARGPAIPIEESGAPGVLACRARRAGGGFACAVPMPPVRAVTQKDGLVRVDLDGITHFITRQRLADGEAASHLSRLAEKSGAGAAGLLQWDGEYMIPLVYVRATGTFVWETGCGSGSAAVGAAEALERGGGPCVTQVRQKGGVITVRCAGAGSSLSVEIEGTVRIAARGEVDVP